MQSIFDDEWRETGPIWPNPEGTGRICPLASFGRRGSAGHFKPFKVTSSEHIRPASTATLIVHRP